MNIYEMENKIHVPNHQPVQVLYPIALKKPPVDLRDHHQSGFPGHVSWRAHTGHIVHHRGPSQHLPLVEQKGADTR